MLGNELIRHDVVPGKVKQLQLPGELTLGIYFVSVGVDADISTKRFIIKILIIEIKKGAAFTATFFDFMWFFCPLKYS